MPEKSKRSLQKNYIIAVIIFFSIAMIMGGLWWWVKFNHLISTDDARVKGTIVTTSAKIPGRLQKILVTEGDTVQAGQVLAEIENAEFSISVAQAKANLAAANAKLAILKAGNRPQEIAQAGASLAQTQANLFNATKKYERSTELYRQGALSAQQLDTEEAALAVAKGQYDGAREYHSMSAEGPRPEEIQYAQAQVEQAEASLENAQLSLKNTIITSPVAGTIAIKSIEPGEVLSVGQPLFLITNPKDIWIAANIEETHISKIKVGQCVDFTIDAYPSITFQGLVSEVGSATGSQFTLLPAENSSGNFTKIAQRLPIKIKALDTGTTTLKPGMSAIVNITIK